jgi:tripartite-type tricarboxylate transporter receptor subunit TctC
MFKQPLIAIGVMMVSGAIASAEEPPGAWPTRPFTLIVPFAAGRPVDVASRLLTPRIGQILGQQVIIENVDGPDQGERDAD